MNAKLLVRAGCLEALLDLQVAVHPVLPELHYLARVSRVRLSRSLLPSDCHHAP